MVAFSLPPPQAGTRVEQLRPGHADEQDRRVAAQVGDVLDEVEEGGLAPVDVVEHDHDRLLHGARLQQLAKSPGDLLGRARRRVVAEDRGQGPDGAAVRDELLHDLGHRPVADSLAVGEAPAPGDRRALEAAEELSHETRLADTRGAEDGEELAGAVAGNSVEGVLQLLALTLAADHRHAVPAGRRLGLHGDEPVGSQRLGLALRGQRRRGLGLDALAHEPVGLLAEQHLAGLGRLLQARRDVDRVAGREPLLGAGDDLAGVHAHAQLQARAVALLELVVQLVEPAAQLVGGAHRAERVVLVHRGHAEDGHDRVADELLDGAAVPLDDRLGRLEVAGHDVPQALGIDPLAEGRRPGDIAEEHRDRLARLANRGGLGQCRAAGVAEARLLAVLGPTARAHGHECESRTYDPV